MAVRASAPLLVLLLVSILLSSSLAYIPTSKRIDTKASGPGPNCSEIGSRSECEKHSPRWCRWCRSDALDDMCFSSSEAWRLPRQVFSCNPSSSSSSSTI